MNNKILGDTGLLVTGPRDWQEDFGQQESIYQCRCYNCDKDFFGDKRRVMCKRCSNYNTERTPWKPLAIGAAVGALIYLLTYLILWN